MSLADTASDSDIPRAESFWNSSSLTHIYPINNTRLGPNGFCHPANSAPEKALRTVRKRLHIGDLCYRGWPCRLSSGLWRSIYDKSVDRAPWRGAGSDHFPDFLLLSSLQSNWQLAALVFPPLCQGLMWSASISLRANFFLHFLQMPFCLSYASRFMLSVNARMFKCRSSPSSTYG